MSVMQCTSRIDHRWLLRKSKDELARIILANVDRIDIFAECAAESHRDTARLDWLYEQGVELRCHVERDEDGLATWFTCCANGKALSHPYGHPRAAIDAARTEAQS
jgi:hypothetical protein